MPATEVLPRPIRPIRKLDCQLKTHNLNVSLPKKRQKVNGLLRFEVDEEP